MRAEIEREYEKKKRDEKKEIQDAMEKKAKEQRDRIQETSKNNSEFFHKAVTSSLNNANELNKQAMSACQTVLSGGMSSSVQPHSQYHNPTGSSSPPQWQPTFSVFLLLFDTLKSIM